METASFSEERFELVVSSLAVHYVSDYRGLMRRVAQWLVPGGVLVFSTEHPVFLCEENWLRPGVRKSARMVSTLLNDVIDAGLTVERVVEPMPTAEQIAEHPEWVHERKRPTFLLASARKPIVSSARRV